MTKKQKTVVKIMALFIVLLTIFNLLLMFGVFDEKPDVADDIVYQEGRDTSLFVGTGRFQILRGVEISDDVEYFCAYDSETLTTIDPDVHSYYQDITNKFLYLLGSQGYTVIGYGENEETFSQHKSLSDFSEDEQAIFNSEHFIDIAEKKEKDGKSFLITLSIGLGLKILLIISLCVYIGICKDMNSRIRKAVVV